MGEVPQIRIRQANDAPIRPEGDFVLYWMIAFRRSGWNFSLQRAAWWARELRRPLLVLEALRVGYPWASDRLHRFVLDGMAENARRFARAGVAYHPYVELRAGEGKGLVAALAAGACVVVTDDYPEFFLPRMVEAAARKLPVRLEAVDSNGLLPLRAADRAFTTARSFRLFLQRNLARHLAAPDPDPLAGARLPRPAPLPSSIARRWPAATPELLAGSRGVLAELPLDHAVSPVESVRGGATAARRQLRTFLDERLARYTDDRNQPDLDATSGLSPWLHFGHIASHEVFAELMRREGWTLGDATLRSNGGARGWWGVSPNAEEFLDELVTWRELGFNGCAFMPDYDRYESLPEWAQATLAAHARDRRKFVYTLEEFETARTHDPLWNAAQNQIRREGRIHNYLRMLWGKKVLEWSGSPRDALAVLLELNNKYGLDGRDPNSYSGVFWVFGRYDRAWPERPIFGKVRFMSSRNTARKVRLERYLERYGGGG